MAVVVVHHPYLVGGGKQRLNVVAMEPDAFGLPVRAYAPLNFNHTNWQRVSVTGVASTIQGPRPQTAVFNGSRWPSVQIAVEKWRAFKPKVRALQIEGHEETLYRHPDFVRVFPEPDAPSILPALKSTKGSGYWWVSHNGLERVATLYEVAHYSAVYDARTQRANTCGWWLLAGDDLEDFRQQHRNAPKRGLTDTENRERIRLHNARAEKLQDDVAKAQAFFKKWSRKALAAANLRDDWARNLKSAERKLEALTREERGE